MGGWKPDMPADNSAQATASQNRANRNAQIYEMIGNRPNQVSPLGETTWDMVLTNPTTGNPYDTSTERWLELEDNPNYDRTVTGGGYRDRRAPYDGLTWDSRSGRWRYENPDYVPEDELVHRWTQTTTFDPEYEAWLNQIRDQSKAESAFRQQWTNEWASQPDMGIPTVASFGTTNPTLGRDDWREFGSTANTINTGDWQQWASPENTINAGDWRQFGNTDQTIDADGWREFGTTNPNLDSGTFDERFGNSGDHGYGDHDMSGGEWNYIDYQPEYIRDKAYDYMYQAEANRLDPQYEQGLNDLKIEMRNQGLQPGDYMWNTRLANFTDSRNDAYEQARLNSMNASRAEAQMLWDQEMMASEQKNRYHQQDIDNQFRARQGNIDNYLAGRQQDMQGFLDYSNAAFGQDMSSRQQQLDADLAYGREAWQQDFNERMRQQQANLDYGREAYGQAYQRTQADRQANLEYGQAAYLQDFQRRQAERDALLNYGNASFRQDLESRQQQMEAELARQRLLNERFNSMDPEAGVSAVQQALA